MAAPVDAPSMAAPIDAPSMAAALGDAPPKTAPVDAPSMAAVLGDAPPKTAPVDAPSMAAALGDAPPKTAPVDGPSKGDAPPKAATGPGLYSEIGKKTRDLLYKDFTTDHKVTLASYTANGAAITATSTKKNEAILSEIQTQFKYNYGKVDVKANSDSQVLITTTSEDLPVPGLKQIMTIAFPNHTDAKAEVQYLHDYAGLSLGFGVNSKPLINISGLVGNKDVAVGADVAYDRATGDFTKYNFGLSFTKGNLSTALMLNNKGDSLSASYYQVVNNNQAAVGGEMSHSFSSNENTATMGVRYCLDPLTTVKGRYDNHGMASALIQHEWLPKSLLTMSAEIDTKAIDKSSKIGLSLLIKP